jgi:cell division protease FtsH
MTAIWKLIKIYIKEENALNTNNNVNDNNNNKNNNNNPKNKKHKRIVSIISGFIVGLLLWSLIFNPFGESSVKKDNIKTYNEFIAHVQASEVEEIDYDSNYKYVLFKLKDSDEVYQTDNPRTYTFKAEMLSHDITVNEVELEKTSFMDMAASIFFLMIQYGLIFGLFMLVFKKMQGGTDEMQIQTSSTNKLADVAGLEEVKESVMTTIDMLKNPKKYEEAGARISKGTLFYGPPGTGKTLLAKAIAGEAGVNFLAMSGSDFDNKYVGVGADKVRKVFEKAKKLSPCIVFIDELDAIGGKRTETDKSYERQTLNQLLACMDGFASSDGVFIFAATNDVNSLDPALLRPGRFDSRFAVGLPDTTKDRMAIIKLYLKNKKLDESVSIESLAKQTIGCSPATIETIINEAAIESVKNGGIITQANIDDAFYRQIMDGHKKKSSERNQKEIQTVAWHEAGHALIGYLQNEEVSKISIVPTTSGAGGVTIFNQKKMGMYSKNELENHIRTLYAGRNAEILLNGVEGVTTGASNDIQEATKCIKHMVAAYGMSKYGLLNLAEIQVPMSELIDEYQSISKAMEDSCMQMLLENRDMLEKLAETLIERETMDENDLIKLFENMKKEDLSNETNEKTVGSTISVPDGYDFDVGM